GPDGGDLAVEGDERDDVGAAVAEGERLADERVLLEVVLDHRRRDVLAARGDDELLLAVDDGEEAVLVEAPDVAGVDPAVLVDQLGGRLGAAQVAGGAGGAADEDLAVVGEFQLHAGEGAADG